MNRVRYPYVPQRVAQKCDIAVCASKIQLLSRKVCYKVSCVKTFSGKVVATSFPYPMVHRSIADNVPINLKLAFKLTRPSENADFESFRLRVLKPWQLARILSATDFSPKYLVFSNMSLMAIFEGNHPQRGRKNGELPIARLYSPYMLLLPEGVWGRGFSVVTPLSSVATIGPALAYKRVATE